MLRERWKNEILKNTKKLFMFTSNPDFSKHKSPSGPLKGVTPRKGTLINYP